MTDKKDEISPEEFDRQIRSALQSYNVPIPDDCPVLLAQDSLLYRTSAGYTVAVHARNLDTPGGDVVVLIPAAFIVDEMNRLVGVLSENGDIDHLRSLGIPVVDKLDDLDADDPKQTLQ